MSESVEPMAWPIQTDCPTCHRPLLIQAHGPEMILVCVWCAEAFFPVELLRDPDETAAAS